MKSTDILIIEIRTAKKSGKTRTRMIDRATLENQAKAIKSWSDILKDETEASKIYDYSLTLACPINDPDFSGWDNVNESDIFPTAEEMSSLYGEGN